MATHLYILYLAADESISGWEFFLLIPKSPQITNRLEIALFSKLRVFYMYFSYKNLDMIGRFVLGHCYTLMYLITTADK